MDDNERRKTMSDRMYSLPFEHLMKWLLGERHVKTVYGVHHLYKADPSRTYTIFDRKLETPFGPAAGPHTQLAQNIAAAYAAGARFFELKTVQTLDGEDLPVAKPCIHADDECYNVEWSTELTVPKAFEEYVKAWFLLHVLAKEYGLGSVDGFQFNMSVGYNLEGISSPKIDAFIEGLKEASQTAIFQECRDWLLGHIHLFQNLTAEDVQAIPGTICNSVTVSTMHGCPPEEIERIATYLLTEKHLNTFVKCNPTLLGYEFVRKTMDELGYTHMAFTDRHFQDDLAYSDAVPMLQRLQKLGKDKGLLFGVKLTNTFPVDIKGGELPGEEMYMSGKPLFFLSMNVAKKLTDDFSGSLRISYSGGADAFNIKNIVDTGIWPVTVATTLLKPGGYERLSQIAGGFHRDDAPSFCGVDGEKIRNILDRARKDAYYRPMPRVRQERKNDQPLPVMDCFMAPCSDTCPIHQDIPAYMTLVREGKYKEALEVILEKNPLPFITGTICYHTCMNSCTRNFYESPVEIRRNKLIAAENGYDAVMAELVPPAGNGKKAAVIGAGPAGLSAAYFLARGGVDVTVFEKNDAAGGMVRSFLCDKKGQITADAIDKDISLVEKMGVHIETDHGIGQYDELADFDYVLAACGVRGLVGAARPADIPGLIVIGDGHYGKTTSVVECIADGKRAAENILHMPVSVATELAADGETVYAQRGQLKMVPGTGCDGRCLQCDAICEVCTEVCPNRANMVVQVPGLMHHQIVHLDALCNECGNCRSFCPWQGAPYKDKLTIFRTQADMDDSTNPGILLIQPETGRFLVRLDGMATEYTVGESGTSVLEEPVRKLIDTLFHDYSYVLW